MFLRFSTINLQNRTSLIHQLAENSVIKFTFFFKLIQYFPIIFSTFPKLTKYYIKENNSLNSLDTRIPILFLFLFSFFMVMIIFYYFNEENYLHLMYLYHLLMVLLIMVHLVVLSLQMLYLIYLLFIFYFFIK